MKLLGIPQRLSGPGFSDLRMHSLAHSAIRSSAFVSVDLRDKEH